MKTLILERPVLFISLWQRCIIHWL